MDFAWRSSDDAFRQRLRDFLEGALPARWHADYALKGPGSHKMMQFAKSFVPKMADAGLLTRHWPKAFGGEESSPWEHIILSEELYSCGEPRSSAYMATNFIGPAIMRFGTPEQKEHHLGAIARGDVFWCQGFSEPSAGSDLASLRTMATPVNGGYLINGSKIWTSYAHSADYCFLLARVEGEAGHAAGITVFMLDMKTEGILVRPISSIAGEGDLHEVFFTDVFAPHSARLGEEGRGWQIVRTALHGERVGAARYEFANRALARAIEVLRERDMLRDPLIARRVLDAQATVEATRLLVYKVIDMRVKDVPPTAETSIARHLMMQSDRIVGALVLDYLPDAATRDGDPFLFMMIEHSRTAGIAAGASEIQLNLISRDMLNLPREK
ncbi:acyl-CoA dehydrogenase family protein [Sphingopyxis sp.]|uniref:acyl-CoA dehydrogenase family protein n=1 Tax=Sphingopyxis sp. TaxID=1908224 RepID=UPI001DEB12FE|nr:acyl-CoA dehydrogenase family protein [Sphingopyxis sp.]MBW8297503.1 acyl-CoA dehydrogenase family protein [Sphingopyxis sp.]